MADMLYCPHCSEPLIGERVKLWDGRVYCRACVEEVSPALYEYAQASGRLEDIVEKSDVRAIHYIINFGKMYLMGLMLFLFLPALLAAFIGWADFEIALGMLIYFGGFGVVWITLKSLIGTGFVRTYFPRILTVHSGHFVVKRPHETKKIPLAECAWYFGSTIDDPDCLITGLRQGIIISTPWKRIACGHSPEMLDHWFAFLKLARIPRIVPLQHLRLLLFICFWTLSVLLLGGAVGFIFWNITNHKLIPPIMLLCFGMWILMTFLYGVIKYDNYDYRQKMCRQVFRPAYWGGIFFPFGLFIGGLASGLEGAFICASITSLIGESSSWFCRFRIRANQRLIGIDAQLVGENKTGSEHGY